MLPDYKMRKACALKPNALLFGFKNYPLTPDQYCRIAQNAQRVRFKTQRTLVQLKSIDVTPINAARNKAAIRIKLYYSSIFCPPERRRAITAALYALLPKGGRYLLLTRSRMLMWRALKLGWWQAEV
jgi:hypothetical protein